MTGSGTRDPESGFVFFRFPAPGCRLPTSDEPRFSRPANGLWLGGPDRSAQIPEHEQAQWHEHHRDELRRRQRVEDKAPAGVAAEELDDEAQHAVEQREAPERPA